MPQHLNWPSTQPSPRFDNQSRVHQTVQHMEHIPNKGGSPTCGLVIPTIVSALLALYLCFARRIVRFAKRAACFDHIHWIPCGISPWCPKCMCSKRFWRFTFSLYARVRTINTKPARRIRIPVHPGRVARLPVLLCLSKSKIYPKHGYPPANDMRPTKSLMCRGVSFF